MAFRQQGAKMRYFFRMCSFPYQTYLRRHKCIFVHIPKTAGTSVLQALGKTSGGRDHLPWYVYYNANPRIYDKYFKFCFVRNPWDRVHSAYRYLLTGGNQRRDLETAETLRSMGTFDNFVVEGLGNGNFRSHALFLPQANFVIGWNDGLMVDFVGRYESLETDFRVIAERLKLNPQLPHKNQALAPPEKNYVHAYTRPEAVGVVEEIYREDILRFNYSFDNTHNGKSH